MRLKPLRMSRFCLGLRALALAQVVAVQGGEQLAALQAALPRAQGAAQRELRLRGDHLPHAAHHPDVRERLRDAVPRQCAPGLCLRRIGARRRDDMPLSHTQTPSRRCKSTSFGCPAHRHCRRPCQQHRCVGGLPHNFVFLLMLFNCCCCRCLELCRSYLVLTRCQTIIIARDPIKDRQGTIAKENVTSGQDRIGVQEEESTRTRVPDPEYPC